MKFEVDLSALFILENEVKQRMKAQKIDML